VRIYSESVIPTPIKTRLCVVPNSMLLSMLRGANLVYSAEFMVYSVILLGSARYYMMKLAPTNSTLWWKLNS
jgi:hypothetical protein